MNKKVFIKTFGCQMNEYDSDKMADVLGAAQGYEPTQNVDEADLKEQIDDMLADIHQTADLRNCEVIDLTLKDEATGRYWNDYGGGWK